MQWLAIRTVRKGYSAVRKPSILMKWHPLDPLKQVTNDTIDHIMACTAFRPCTKVLSQL
jgi:hypothetical protein